MTFTEINNITGFANGEKFHDADEVRAYFRKSNILEMLDPMSQERRDYDRHYSDADFAEMAHIVIANHWHMTE